MKTEDKAPSRAGDRFERLRAAVRAYDNALRAYGLLGSAWVEHSDELDRLWAAVLDAAGISRHDFVALPNAYEPRFCGSCGRREDLHP